MNQEFAPQPIMRAALHTLHRAAVETRNWTLRDDVPREQINALWQALHEVPDLLMNWRDDEECSKELMLYLQEYDASWPTPRLTTIYEDALH